VSGTAFTFFLVFYVGYLRLQAGIFIVVIFSLLYIVQAFGVLWLTKDFILGHSAIGRLDKLASIQLRHSKNWPPQS